MNIITINSADDAIHSNYRVIINEGNFTISTGDDGVHADTLLGINGGDIQINKSYEGIESQYMVINDGKIHINSSDDGINAADGSEAMAGPGGGGQRPGGGFPPGGGIPTARDFYLYINGGYIAIQAVGDGIDINGSVVMTDGAMIIHGPTANMNGALDYDASFKISGGLLVAVGSSGMAQAPDAQSSQYSLLLNFRSTINSGTMLSIQTSTGEQVLTFKPSKLFQSLAFSSGELKKGTTYNVYYGGSSDATEQDGLFTKGNYTPGTKYTSFTISSMVTKINSR